MDRRKARIISSLLGIIVAVSVLLLIEDEPKPQYFHNSGKVFGTYYSIRYQALTDLQDSINAALQAFDNSLSMFNPRSTLSAINTNRDTTTDAFIEQMWAEAERVYLFSGGAFDITVAPLVNLWGFGFKNRGQVTQAKIDSLLPLVGFGKVRLENHHVVKSDPRMMIDGGAVAKGQACDMIAAVLERNGSADYLVEIGGEIVSRGVNAKGDKWHIGITKPVEETADAPQSSELQEIIAVHNICMATSGNYRNFYYEGEEKRSHTIDPRTGRPVQHPLLSATVVSSSCMRADALATACMVLGADKALEMMDSSSPDACYLIVAEGDSTVVRTSENWEERLQN
ncbi:MAG: FAD:protein FMN transferase [Paludibacteraceae bacterium]|nr:FAD:protein FMN transferase [Paludibacteraceae bacterium]